MGTSYQRLLDEALQARAEELLRAGSLKMDAIAACLGFADLRSFRRAFHR